MQTYTFQKLSAVAVEQDFTSTDYQHVIVEDGGNIRRVPKNAIGKPITTTLSDTSTDNEVPSAKAVYEAINAHTSTTRTKEYGVRKLIESDSPDLERVGDAVGLIAHVCTGDEKVQNDFNADYTDSWYVLGILYNQLPGGISFGDKDFAISYMRRCVDTQDNVNRNNLTNYLELAQQLVDRDWSASKRAKEFDKMQKKYNAETVPTEKMKYYEGKDGKNGKPFYSTVTQDKISDKQEAVMILKYALAFYEKTPVKFDSDAAKLDEINKLLAAITK